MWTTSATSCPNLSWNNQREPRCHSIPASLPSMPAQKELVILQLSFNISHSVSKKFVASQVECLLVSLNCTKSSPDDTIVVCYSEDQYVWITHTAMVEGSATVKRIVLTICRNLAWELHCTFMTHVQGLYKETNAVIFNTTAESKESGMLTNCACTHYKEYFKNQQRVCNASRVERRPWRFLIGMLVVAAGILLIYLGVETALQRKLNRTKIGAVY